jgi:hypothetical protein
MQETTVPSGVLRTMRIIHAALCLGVVTVTVALVVVRHVQQAPANEPMLIYIGIALAVANIAAAWFVPGAMDRETRRRMARGDDPAVGAVDPEARWALLYQNRLIVRCALLEGAGFFQPIAYLLAGHPVNLVVAGVLFLLLVLQFPTAEVVRSWADRQRDQVEQERQSALG